MTNVPSAMTNAQVALSVAMDYWRGSPGIGPSPATVAVTAETFLAWLDEQDAKRKPKTCKPKTLNLGVQ